jgi:tetratricopeptide (TPR) repeat protein
VLSFSLRRAATAVLLRGGFWSVGLQGLLAQSPQEPARKQDGTAAGVGAKSGKATNRGLSARQILSRIEGLQGPEADRWDQLFSEAVFSDNELAGALQILHDQGRRESAIVCIESALRAGRVAPWLYDLLALQMKLAGRPAEEVGRVLQSRLDFGVSELPEMLMTAAMLSRFEAWDASLTLLRDAAELNPNRPETWLLARSVADKSGDDEQRIWARCGILKWVWTSNWEREHEEAVKVLEGFAKALDSRQASAAAAELRGRMAVARRRDVQVSLRWVGNADLDLLITDPNGEECSFRRLETSTFGRLVRQDGSLDAAAARTSDTRLEQFIQPEAPSGRYRAAVRFVGGRVASGTAILEVIQHAGTAAETRKTHTIRTGNGDTSIEFVLTDAPPQPQK